MKKFVFSLFALFGMTSAVSAQSVTVSDVEALPGETVNVTLNFECPADIYTGMQIAMQFPTGFSCSVAAEDALSGWNGLIPYEYKDGVLKYSAAGTKKYSEAAISVEFTISSEVAVGDYKVTVSGQLEGPGEEGSITTEITPVDFYVKVVSPVEVTLSENNTEDIEAVKYAIVTVERSIAAGNWSTICLPFAMTEDQVKSAFGEGVIVQDFIGYDYVSAEDHIKVKFSPVTAMEANHPYIIKVKDKIEKFVVDGVVSIEASDEPIVKPEKGMEFSGVYKVGYLPKESLYIFDNKFYYAPKKNTVCMKAFRGYFEFDDFETSRSVTFFDEQTGINSITTLTDGEYYDLKGQRVENPSKGIYIKDGKKVVVK